MLNDLVKTTQLLNTDMYLISKYTIYNHETIGQVSILCYIEYLSELNYLIPDSTIKVTIKSFVVGLLNSTFVVGQLNS